MRFQVITMRSKGRNMHREAQLKVPKFTGDLSVDRQQDPELSRPLLRARLTDVAGGVETDVLPVLDDAQLIWAGNRKMRITGFERVDGADYAQTWAMELV